MISRELTKAGSMWLERRGRTSQGFGGVHKTVFWLSAIVSRLCTGYHSTSIVREHVLERAKLPESIPYPVSPGRKFDHKAFFPVCPVAKRVLVPLNRSSESDEVRRQHASLREIIVAKVTGPLEPTTLGELIIMDAS
jgi:hypothetical protein